MLALPGWNNVLNVLRMFAEDIVSCNVTWMPASNTGLADESLQLF